MAGPPEGSWLGLNPSATQGARVAKPLTQSERPATLAALALLYEGGSAPAFGRDVSSVHRTRSSWQTGGFSAEGFNHTNTGSEWWAGRRQKCGKGNGSSVIFHFPGAISPREAAEGLTPSEGSSPSQAGLGWTSGVLRLWKVKCSLQWVKCLQAPTTKGSLRLYSELLFQNSRISLISCSPS